jgi:adenylosuccinate lyase
MNRMICEEFGFDKCFAVCGQTYPRKLDSRILNCLSSVAQSCYRMANDIRLLQHDRQIEEPFEKSQIGSSAMAYKRNPMRSERITSLSRYVISDLTNPAMTAATQWLERTLDDSANKRISVAEGFLATDAILELYINIVSAIVVYPKMIEKRLLSELPFMATENILMEAVKRGGDRQALHERIRVHSMEAGKVVKVEGGENDLIDRIASDDAFGMTKEEIMSVMEPKNFIGRADKQVTEFLESEIYPILEENRDLLGINVEINV